jgi:predicted nucleic acid-binding protein
MNAAVFVDTNVFVYARQSGEAVKQPIAREWLERLWKDQSGRTSAQVVSEYYVSLTRKIKPAVSADDAWDEVQTLLSWNPQPTDADLLVRGRTIERRYRLSWWDSLIVAAAQAQNCALLLTEDLQDRSLYGGVMVRNPFALRVSEAAAAYTSGPTVISQHRARGRPRKTVSVTS